MSMTLNELLDGSVRLPEIRPRHLSMDSRLVSPGDLFIALRGGVADGHDFANAAVARGALAVLAERRISGLSVPVVEVPDLAARLPSLAARFYGDPSNHLYCVGVTGTNGKTSIAHYIAELASRLGWPAGYMGTIGWGRIGALESAKLTTEDPVTLQRRLAALRDDGCKWAALEVSSHALAQGRVDAVRFAAAAFSNLSRDHLDYHASAEDYGNAKARLFRGAGLDLAVINVDDGFGRKLCAELPASVTLVRYGRGGPDVGWSDLRFAAAGVTGYWRTRWGDHPLSLPVHAEFSVANVAAALGVLCHAGASLADFAEAAAKLGAVPGRMEYFRAPGKPDVVVDFAHTPDALDKVLDALRERSSGRLICVFGCGGDRDRGKRPLMARAAERHADVLWLTSDNPRSEHPDHIIAEIRAGLTGCRRVHVCADRAEAIRGAIGEAAVGDTVLVAGKGHEDYQEISGERLPFSDRARVAAIMEGTA